MTDIKWEKYIVQPDQKVDLEERNPYDNDAWESGKSSAKKRLQKLSSELEGLQELLYAQALHKILIILQGTDTSGKDGVIRHVFQGVNPQGVKVASFKVPTPPELAHDYLWRVHRQVPGRGEMVIFNRSHYEDVLVVRVHNLVPRKQWQLRYDQINHFEEMLAEEGTTILKFFLHIDLKEQHERLLARINDPLKNWKFNPGDLKERQLWGEYQKAYEAVLERTSKKKAPWIIVPANRKWYRNLIVSAVIVDTLKGLKMEYPQSKEDLKVYRDELNEG